MPEPEIAIRKPFPGPLIAFAMTYLAWWTQFAWTIVGQRFAPLQAAMAFAFLMAYGLIGVLALSSVEKPWGPRIGLTAIPARSVPALVLLIPIPFVAVAVQALVRLPLMRGRATGIWEWHGPLLSARSDLGLLGSLMVVVVLIPLLAEWFFRGVLQQGVVAKLGAVRGVLVTAALYGAIVAGLRTEATSWIAVFSGTFVAGIVLGAARQVTGSLWAPVVVHAGASALHALTQLLGSSAPIPFLSAPGRLVPLPVALVALVTVAAGLVFLLKYRGRRDVPLSS
jgi:membrane protease YdiL (CAAX protease family)